MFLMNSLRSAVHCLDGSYFIISANVSSIPPETGDLHGRSQDYVRAAASTVQVASVVSDVVVSVLSFNSNRLKEAEARKFEAERPCLELRRNNLT